MKPIKAVDTATDAVAAAQPSLVESLKAIDVSSLDRLIAIGQEHARITEYRAKTEEKKRDVTEAVYLRVSQDYTRRATALEEQSAPLRAQARAEYRKLKSLLEAVGARKDQAQLQKDEMRFRHEVGELTDVELAARLVDPQNVLDQCASDSKELEASKARFVEALGSEQALEAGEPVATAKAAPAPAAAIVPAAAAAVPPAPAAAVAAAAPVASVATAVPAAVAAAAPAAAVSPAPALQSPAAANARSTPPPAVPPANDDDAGATRVAQVMPELDQATRVVSATAPAAKAAPPAAAPAPADDGSDGATMMLATAAVVIDGAGGKEFPLTVLNGIGRAEDNRICLSSPGISRKHAVITAASGGFVIKDLGSQNGTFVNGQRVTGKKLAEGDTIEVGSVKFVFRSPWPARGGAAAGRGEAAAQGKR